MPLFLKFFASKYPAIGIEVNVNNMSRPGFRSHLSIEMLIFLNKCCEFGTPHLPGLLIFSVVPILLIPIYQILIILLNDKLVKYQLEIH